MSKEQGIKTNKIAAYNSAWNVIGNSAYKIDGPSMLQASHTIYVNKDLLNLRAESGLEELFGVFPRRLE